MSSDNSDKNQNIVVSNPKGFGTSIISLEHIKNEYICEGLSSLELSQKYLIPIVAIDRLIEENRLEELRAAHVKHGLAKLQNIQVGQAEKLMNMEVQFKKMRIAQLEKILEDHLAYYSKYGHFYKIHPISGDILRDTNGIPMQIRLPNVSKEINDLKESVQLSEGLKMLLGQIDAIINKPKDSETLDADFTDLTNVGNIFQHRKSDD